MRVIKWHNEPEMSLKVFNKQIAFPVMGASLSGVKTSMNDVIPEETFYRVFCVEQCLQEHCMLETSIQSR